MRVVAIEEHWTTEGIDRALRVGRSPRADGVTGATPDEHAEDLHRLISELDAGPVDIFASSEGAVNALALVTRMSAMVSDPRWRGSSPSRASGDRLRPTSTPCAGPPRGSSSRAAP